MYLILFFLLGIVLGALCNFLGKRLPTKEDLLKRDSCESCGYEYRWYEHSHILLYFFRSGRCPDCGKRLDFVPVLNELFTGLLFALAFYIFGFSLDLLIALGIVCLLMIVLVSDLTYMVIPDEVLIFFNAYFIILLVFDVGLIETMIKMLSGLFLFGVMYLIMLVGNYLLKGESLGGGDVKMMFTFGLLLGPIVGILSIFLSSLLALPISILIMQVEKNHIIPFGPFLLVTLLFLYFTGVNSTDVIEFFRML